MNDEILDIVRKQGVLGRIRVNEVKSSAFKDSAEREGRLSIESLDLRIDYIFEK